MSSKSVAEVKFHQNKLQIIPWNYSFPEEVKSVFKNFDWISLEYGQVLFRGSHQIREYLEATLPDSRESRKYCLGVILTTLSDNYEFDVIGWDDLTGEYNEVYLSLKNDLFSLVKELEEEGSIGDWI